MADKIAHHRFIRLDRPPELTQGQIALHTRPGTDGVTLHFLGTWAAPLELTSRAQAPSVREAARIYRRYLELVGGDAVEITWADVPYITLGHRFFVVGVHDPQIQPVLLGTGPDGDYRATLECRWTIQPVKI